MKILFITLMFIGTTVFMQGQSEGANNNVSEAFSSEEVSAMSPDKLEYYAFFSQEVFQIFNNEKDPSDLQDISVILNKTSGIALSVSELSDGDFNPLLFDLMQDQASATYYRVGDTGSVLMIQSTDRLNTLYARYKANK